MEGCYYYGSNHDAPSCTMMAGFKKHHVWDLHRNAARKHDDTDGSHVSSKKNIRVDKSLHEYDHGKWCHDDAAGAYSPRRRQSLFFEQASCSGGRSKGLDSWQFLLANANLQKVAHLLPPFPWFGNRSDRKVLFWLVIGVELSRTPVRDEQVSSFRTKFCEPFKKSRNSKHLSGRCIIVDY